MPEGMMKEDSRKDWPSNRRVWLPREDWDLLAVLIKKTTGREGFGFSPIQVGSTTFLWSRRPPELEFEACLDTGILKSALFQAVAQEAERIFREIEPRLGLMRGTIRPARRKAKKVRRRRR